MKNIKRNFGIAISSLALAASALANEEYLYFDTGVNSLESTISRTYTSKDATLDIGTSDVFLKDSQYTRLDYYWANKVDKNATLNISNASLTVENSTVRGGVYSVIYGQGNVLTLGAVQTNVKNSNTSVVIGISALYDGERYESKSINVGSLTTVISDGSQTASIYGGGYIGGANLTVAGNVLTQVNGSTTGSVIVGAGAEYWSTADNTYCEFKGLTSAEIVSSSVNNIYGSWVAQQEAGGTVSFIAKDLLISVSDSTVRSNIFAGGWTSGAGASSVFANSTTNISNSNVAGNIYLESVNTDGSTGATVTGNIALNLSGNNAIASISSEKKAVVNHLNGVTTVGNMSSFTGVLNVNAGVMQANNKLGASVITIVEGATLGLKIAGDNTLTNADLSFTNNGTLILNPTLGLAPNPGGYAISAATGVNYGNVVSYGGTFSEGIFTLGAQVEFFSSEIQTSPILDIIAGSNIKITDDIEGTPTQTVAIVTLGSGESIYLNRAEVANFLDPEYQITMPLQPYEKIVTAWTFDISGVNNDNSVVLSFMLGGDLNMADVRIWHKDGNDVWENITASLQGLTYSNGALSFVATAFSDYAITAIPEPASLVLLGMSLLVVTLIRRRKLS